ncbi:hypothetical protein R1flu_019732 [Riccia fluitans]|uniref:Uncharacterized protein n=1 Tax=Riccia fluitans TaxID=41844 RepID=A0ABD1ZNB8_9MARC
MDGHLVWPVDLDVDVVSQKKNKKKETGSKQPSRKRPRSESDPKDGNEGNLPSTVIPDSFHRSEAPVTVNEASCLEIDPPLSTPTGKTSSRGNNHIAPGDTTKEVPPTSSKLPSDGIMEESVSQMTTMLSNILEHHRCANQRLASLEEDLIHEKKEEEKLKGTIEALEREE